MATLNTFIFLTATYTPETIKKGNILQRLHGSSCYANAPQCNVVLHCLLLKIKLIGKHSTVTILLTAEENSEAVNVFICIYSLQQCKTQGKELQNLHCCDASCQVRSEVNLPKLQRNAAAPVKKLLSHSANEELPRLLWKRKVPYRLNKSLPQDYVIEPDECILRFYTPFLYY